MPYAVFEDIVMQAPMEEICEKKNDRARAMILSKGGPDYSGSVWLTLDDVGKMGWRNFLNAYVGEWTEAPWSDGELTAAYEEYMVKAQATRHLYESGELQAVWTKVLKQLPEVGSFAVRSWDYSSTLPLDYREETKGKSWKERGCQVYEHKHSNDGGHTDAVCRSLQEPVGEALFSAMLASLSAAGSSIKKLEINCAVDGNFTWADDGRLAGLDLSQLHELNFSPHGAEIGEAYKWRPGKQQYVEARCGLAVTALLTQSAASLKKLSLSPECPMFWPPEAAEDPDDVVALPVLEELSTSAQLRLEAFAEFLRKAENLKSLSLACNHGQDGNWRDMWRAIRYHPSRMRLDFDQIPCNDAAEISLGHYTGEASKDEWDDDVWMNITHSLENYLSNKGEWNASCRMWFEDEDASSDGSNDGGSGDEDDWEDEGSDNDQ